MHYKQNKTEQKIRTEEGLCNQCTRMENEDTMDLEWSAIEGGWKQIYKNLPDNNSMFLDMVSLTNEEKTNFLLLIIYNNRFMKLFSVCNPDK